MFSKIKYIYWSKEAKKVTLPNEDLITKIKHVKAERRPAASKTLRKDFNEKTYAIDRHGDYYELYLMENGKYVIYSSNGMDESKNVKKAVIRPDRLFDGKFCEFNGKTLRRAFGFVDKEFKRCIPKQFYYINDRYLGKKMIASSIDASSQYPSGCYGKMPDSHDYLMFEGVAEPTPEYPFAFYVKSGTLKIYGELDTREWMASRFAPDLFRLSGNDEYRYAPIRDKDEITYLMKASEYTMDETWDFFYRNKQSKAKDSPEYADAKLVMNGTIGCWHRKDKGQKRCMAYDDGGSYQLAHLVAVAIARGNQKILNKAKEIGENRVMHICVDGLIYYGDDVRSDGEKGIGKFSQEFVGCDFMMTGMNLYCAEKDGKPVKFRHAAMDLIDGKKIDDSKPHFIKDLVRLSAKERIGDII